MSLEGNTVKRQRTVLILDDCPEVRETYCRYLLQDVQYSYILIEQKAGKEALEQCKHQWPDAILLNWMLPDMDGLEFLTLLREQSGKSDLPVVMITGQGREELAVAAIELGASDYLLKEKVCSEVLRLAVTGAIQRDRLKQALQESEQWFQHVMMNAPGPMMICAEDGEVLQINYAWSDLSGYGPEDIATIADWTEKAYGERRELTLADVDRLYDLNERISEGEYRITTRNGEQRIWELYSAPLGMLPDKRRGIIKTAQDITQARQTENQLIQAVSREQESRDRFRSIVESISDAFYAVDCKGNFVYINHKASSLWEKSAEALIGKSIAQESPTEIGSGSYRHILQVLEQGKACEFETFCPASNTWIYERFYPTEDGVSAFILDISDRKRAEIALRESNQRYINLAASAPVGIFRTDRAGNCLYVNERWCQMAGITSAEAMGFGWVTSLHTEDCDQIAAAWFNLIHHQQHFHLEYRFQRPDETITWVFGQALPERTARGEIIGYIGTITDITERKQTEHALQEREMMLRALGDNLPNGMIYKLVRELDGSNRLQYISAGCERISEMTPEAVLQDASLLYQQVLEEDRPLLEQAVEASLENLSILDLQFRKQTPSGIVKWLHLRSAPRRLEDGRTVWDGIEFDITDLKVAELALRESEEKFRQIAEHTNIVFFVKAADLNELLYVNPAYETVWGRSCKDLYQNPQAWVETIHPADRDRVLQAKQQTLGQALSEEYRILRPDGTQRWISACTSIIYDSYQQPYRIVGKAEDITERKYTEIQLQEAKTELELRVTARTVELTTANAQLQRQLGDLQQAESALRTSEQRFQAFMQHSPASAWITDAEGKILYLSPTYCRTFQVVAQEMVGKTIFDVYPLEFATEYFKHIQLAVKTKQVIEVIETTPQEVGSTGSFLVYKFPIMHESGTCLVGGVSIDITHRLEAEAKQQESEQRLKLALEAARMGTWDWNILTNDVIYSEQFGSIFGLTLNADCASYETFMDCVHPEDRDGVQQVVQETIAAGTDYEQEFRVIYSDGTIHWVSQKGQVYYNKQGQPIRMLGVGTDITEQKHVEEKLFQRQQEFTALAENAPNIIARLDRNLRYLYINPSAAKVAGIPCHTFLDKTNRELGLPEETLVVTEAAQAAFETGQEQLIEFNFLTLQGLRFYQSRIVPERGLRGSIESILTVAHDITELKLTEEALRKSEAKFRSLSEFAPIGIFLIDERGRCIYTNPRAQAIAGYTSAEAMGDGWMQFVHLEDRQAFLTQWLDTVVQKDKDTLNRIVRFVHRDGNVRYGRVQTAPIPATNGELVGHVGTIEDITDSQKVEQMKNEFISVVSHELRTPLTGIRGSLGLLATGTYDKNPEKAKRMLYIAATQTERLVRLVNDILSLEKLESGKMTLAKQSCSVEMLLTQSVEIMRAIAEQNQITLSVNSLDAEIFADPDSIIQTLTNLLSNAIKFSPENSTVTLTAKLLDDQSLEKLQSARRSEEKASNLQEVSFTLTEEPLSLPCMLFAVQDQGRGIPSDKLETIFERFQQVDASDARHKDGTGLGLAICRSIVQQHHGQIWAESTLGSSSTFYFTLPCHPPDRPSIDSSK